MGGGYIKLEEMVSRKVKSDRRHVVEIERVGEEKKRKKENRND